MLLLFSVLIQTHAALASPGENGYEANTEHKLEHLSKELQLSADQKAKLEAIFNEKHEKFRAIREESQSRIKQVLNDEQMAKWDSIKRQRFESRFKQ